MVDMKKPDMAEAAEQLLAATDWLPALMRTPKAVQERVKQAPTDAGTEAHASVYADAAE
jgi:ParB family chromosome partitioning protein